MKSLVIEAGVAVLLALWLSSAAGTETVHIYNWTDSIGRTTLKDFQQVTGLLPVYDVFESNEMLDAKLLAGKSGYDVVVPSNNFLAKQIRAGAFQPLDKNKLQNWNNLDPDILQLLQGVDPGNQYGVPYLGGSVGIGYNVDKIKAILGLEKIESWATVFEPRNIEQLSQCGVAILDSPDELFAVMLNYLGLDPNSSEIKDYKLAQEKLLLIRPYITYFHSAKYISDLANGNICVAIGYSGDIYQAAARAQEAGKDIDISYSLPKEGSKLAYDMLAIPADAQNPDAALAFIDYILRPEVIARISEDVGYPNPNYKSYSLISRELLDNPMVFPEITAKKQLFVATPLPFAIQRFATRSWAQIKSGR
ncbi:polyamine ABC transporter substrate-binding protein [Pseudomonas sp. R26(2017)]|uniref:polyamine ABC transporter substrate-binding protein n=1 Tax=unclassified Pseudomonas TaxID=196821 RepID=UPI000A1DD385